MTEDEKVALAEQLRKQYSQNRKPVVPEFFTDHADAHAHNHASARDLYLAQFGEMFTMLFTSFLSAWKVPSIR